MWACESGSRRVRRRLALWSLLFVTAFGRADATPDEEGMAASTHVATVNGDPITAGEFVDSLRRWRFRYEDAAKLRRVALDECVRFKVIQQLAREHGLLADVSDEALRRAFVEENRRRAAAIARGGIVFGPRQLKWEQFRATWLDKMERDIGRRLIVRESVQSSSPAGEIDDLEALETAVHAATKVAKVKPDHGVIARLEANTPLPIRPDR